MRVGKLLAYAVPILIAAAAVPSLAAPAGPEGQDFEAQLSSFRRSMIAACAQFQAGRPRESTEQLDAELAELQTMWTTITDNFRGRPPAAYVSDSKWPGYFDSVAENLDGMRSAAASHRYSRAFAICGSTCGLFVSIHEANGISTVCDKLFHFRKQAKLIMAQIKNGHSEAARQHLRALLAQRDAVVLSPVPEKAESDPAHYRQLIAEFSRAVDSFAIALTDDRADAALARYEEMMRAFTAVYNRYI